MDPITLATVTAAVSVLAAEIAKGAASEVGKDIWKKIKGLLGWKSDPDPAAVAPTVAEQLQNNNEVASQIIALLKQAPSSDTFASALVQNIDAEKVIVAGRFDVQGDFQM
jgi:hypothetical protein